VFRGLRTQTEAAEKQVLVGRAKLEGAEQQLFLDTASAYLGVLRDEAALKLERDHGRVPQENLEETQVLGGHAQHLWSRQAVVRRWKYALVCAVELQH